MKRQSVRGPSAQLPGYLEQVDYTLLHTSSGANHCDPKTLSMNGLRPESARKIFSLYHGVAPVLFVRHLVEDLAQALIARFGVDPVFAARRVERRWVKAQSALPIVEQALLV